MSCDECKRQRKLINKEPDCGICKISEINSSNKYIIGIVNNYQAMLINNGGVSSDGLRYVVHLEGIPSVIESLVVDKLLVYITTALNTQYKDDTNG